MLKKSLIILFAFCLVLFTSSICFASNIMQDMQAGLDNIGNGMENAVNGAKNTVGDAKNGVENMMSDMGRGIEGAMNNAEDDMTNDDPTGMNGENGDGYSADRTSATTRAISDTSAAGSGTGSSFVWIVLAIAAVIIVALVWYYGTQTEKRNND